LFTKSPLWLCLHKEKNVIPSFILPNLLYPQPAIWKPWQPSHSHSLELSSETQHSEPHNWGIKWINQTPAKIVAPRRTP
jgi:hypothetical protein